MRDRPKPRSGRPKAFFSANEQTAILDAIRSAEMASSAEIRVHLEHRCPGDVYDRAKTVFEEIGMTATELRNGVLIYFATGDRKFAVLGDSGIHEKVGDDFWQDVVANMEENFRAGGFVLGMTLGIARIGEKLAIHFPHAGEDDRDELPDDLSIGD